MDAVNSGSRWPEAVQSCTACDNATDIRGTKNSEKQGKGLGDSVVRAT